MTSLSYCLDGKENLLQIVFPEPSNILDLHVNTYSHFVLAEWMTNKYIWLKYHYHYNKRHCKNS